MAYVETDLVEENIQLHNDTGKTELRVSNDIASFEEVKVKTTFDITDIIGEDGRWQRRIFYMTLICGITMSWNHLGIAFLALPVEYWCARPDGTSISLEIWKYRFLPNVTIGGELHHSQCEMFTSNFYFNETEKCSSWEYSSEYHSVVEQWDLVCEKSWLLSMSQSIYMLGFFVASSLTGQMSDLFGRGPVIIACVLTLVLFSIATAFSPSFTVFGRRPVILACVLTLFLSSIATAFSPSFTVFVILRCFVALGQAGMDLAVFVLLTEVFGPSCRATYIMLQTFTFCLGYMLLPLIAWSLSDWFYLQLAFSLPCLGYMAFYWTIPESPRWLLIKGHTEKAIRIIKSALEENGTVIHDLEQKIQKIYCLQEKEKESEKRVTFVDLFRTPNLRRKTLYLFFIWITIAFTYYGLSLYSTELYGNKFLNFFFSALTEVPTSIYCLLTANRYGRKRTLFLSIAIGGLSCLGFIVIPKGYEIVQNILAMSGKLFVSGAFTIVYLFSAEIFPTVARNSGIGICSMVARIGSALSPFMRDLGQATNASVPLVLFGILCVISSMLLLKLPETNFQPIPETLDEAEVSLPRHRKKLKWNSLLSRC